MKKKVFSLMMTLLLAFIGVAKAEVVTIGDGTSTTYVTPFNSLWGYSFVEQIYTADEIGTAGTINAISFNLRESDAAQTNSVDVFMKAVTRTSFSGTTDYEAVTASDMVFSGTVTFSPGWTTITLDTPFEYDGTSNLMIGMHEYTSGYSTLYFYYTSAADKVITFHSDGANPDPYNLGSYSGNKYVSPNRANIQIDITAGGGGGGAGEQLFAVQNGDEVETVEVGPRPNGCWMEPFTFQIRNTGAATTITHLDWTPQEYFTLVAPELPVNIARDEDMDVQLSTGTSTNTEWQMVAIYGNGRTAAVWNITAEPYDPAKPDVWEMACEDATEFPFVEVPATAHNVTLYDNYDLPFDEIPEGYDAVYKLVFDNDMVLDAEVTAGADGKVALYAEGFNGEGGPMATNNYNGPMAGGGAAGAPFEAQIGEGTSTTGYFPFYTLYNYSIAENLYLATELAEADVTTAPMTSLSWYATNAPGYAQQGITIWMANVEDTELTTTSHIVTNMTKVYTGAMTPEIGWNEFVFNEGTFAWDGESNVLIFCQRNNGAWNSTVNWQATTSLPFNAMAYRYQDSGAYDPTVANAMYTSTTRPNVIMKAARGNRSGDVVLEEGFEDGTMPLNWHSEGDNVWVVGTGDYSTSTGAHTGSYNAMCTHSSNLNETYLVSPAMDLSGATEATLSFAYVNRSWAGDTDEFGVYYRVNGGAWNELFYTEEAHSTWTEASVALTGLAANYELGFMMYDNYGYGVGLDDVVVEASNGGGEEPTGEISYGPVITNAPVAAGTYYLVTSSTDADFEVTINAEDMPCPAVEGFAFGEMPADDDDEIEPASVTLKWNNPANATEYQVVFGSTYYPQPNHPQTVISDWTPVTGATGSFTVRNLWNNTNYFWYVVFRNGGACEDGVESPHWGFTTNLNVPQGLTAVDETVFNDETITLNWSAVVDRTYRQYFIYRDGVKVGETQMNNISNTTYTDGPLAYNMDGYTYYVTAIYDEGESNPSNTVNVKVSGRGNVDGHVYEQDGETGIAGATVTMIGQDEFGVNHTYNFTTNAQGFYSGAVYAGSYNGQAGCDGYQTIYEPVQGNPIAIAYNQTTSPIDYVLDENFDPVCGVIAEYYPDSLDPESPYVKVYWGCGLPGSDIIEDFETGDFSMFDWQVDPTYPWSITTNNPYEGTYCMKSGGAGVGNVISNMTVTVDIPADGLMSFFAKISCENNWDYGYFYIDGVQKGSFTGAGNWIEKTYDITAGEHTFQWRYTKDNTVNSNDDCFYVDYINFYKQPEPAVPGMTYDFEDGTMQGWTSVDADGDGYGWYMGSEIMTGQTGNNGSNDFVLSQSYYMGSVLYPDNYLVSPQVALGGVVTFYACAQDASYAAEHFGVAVSTTNTNPSSFTMLQEWTMTAKDAAPSMKKVSAIPSADVKGMGHSRNGNTREQGNWYQYTVDLSAYAGQTGYVAIRHFNCSDMFYLNVDDITISDPSKSAPASRRFSHYRVYRTDCYNVGPYTLLDDQHPDGNTVVLACELHDTVYIDVEWADLDPGIYKWGVGCVYVGNRGELYESPITWTQPVAVNDNYRVFEGKDVPENNFKSVFSTGDVSDYMPNRGNATVILTAGDVWGDGSGYQMLLDADANAYGTIIPETGALSTNCSGNDAIYGEFEYKIPVNADGNCSTSNIVINNSVSLEIPAGTYDWCITNPTPGDRIWIAASTGNVGGRENDYVFEEGMVYEFVMSMHGTNDGVDVTITSNPNPPTPPTPPTPGTDDLQEPRESEIVWSNCLDKNMYLNEGDVTVNVLLNSADSPEGITVDFTNLNPGEQELYPVDQVVLDETGYYAFESFRRGDYAIQVRFDGYEPIDDTVSIWEPVDLRYVMIEIIYGVSDLYVSSTGWAMWDAEGMPTPGGGGGGGGQGSAFSYDLEAGLPAGWNVIDGNNDGWTWCLTSAIPSTWTYYASLTLDWYRSGTDAICSGSYINGVGALTPDEYLVTEQVTLTNGSTFSFWAAATDASYPADHFGVFVSDNGTSGWEMVNEWTLTGKGGDKAGDVRASRDGNGQRLGSWHNFSVDLSAYAGQQKYIAIRHFNCNDQYIMCVDDIELTAGAKSEANERHLEYFKVMCESLDHEPIFNANVPADQPFCQVATEELVPGEHYIAKVAAMYSTGMSAWTECEWQYIPCTEYAGTVNGVTIEGNEISWEYPGGGGGGGTTGDTFTVDFENSAMPAGWTVIDGGSPAGYGWQIGSTKLGGTGNGHNGSADLILSQSYDNNYGVVYPDNWFISPAVTLGSGSTFSFWACGQDAGYAAEHCGVFVSTTGTNPSDFTMVEEWTLSAKSNGEKAAVRGNRDQGTWRQYTVDLSDYAGAGRYVAIRHFNCSDQFYLDVDDIELSNGAKSNRNPWDLMMTFTAPEGGHYGVAYDGNNFYTSNWGYSSAAHNFYKYDLQGNMLEGFEIPGCGTLRGITYDGTYFYGVANSSTVYCVDLANHSVVSTFTTSYGAMRGITYDPVRDGFWVIGNWSGNLTLIDRTGAVQQTGPAPESASDLAYYMDENDVEHIYCFNNGTNDVNDWVIGNTTMGGSVFNFSSVPGFDGGSSGGCTVGSFNGKIAFIGDVQQSPNLIGVYELRDDNVGPVPPTPTGDVLGAMIFADGEWEAFVEYPTNTYTYEGDAEEVCVRIVYNGTNNLPEGNIYFSMSCPECEPYNPSIIICEAGDPIHGEQVDANHVKVWWGEEPIVPGAGEWYFYDNGVNEDAIGTNGGNFWWGVMFPAGSYEGNMVTKVAAYDYMAMTGNVTIYNDGANAPANAVGQMNVTMTGSEDFVEYEFAEPVVIDPTKNVWIVFYNGSGATFPAAVCANTGDANGRWVSLDGNTWEDIAGYDLDYTFMVRAYIAQGAKGEVREIAIEQPAGDGGVLAVSGNGARVSRNRASIVKYNVYRSADNETYELIGEVAEDGSGYYEYIDSPTVAGTYYYQVRAYYDNECESEPAMAYDNPTVDYVMLNTTAAGVDENDGMAIFPNPTKGNVTIQAAGMQHITVVSVLGQVVYDADVAGDELILNMSKYTAGMYTVRVMTENGVRVERITVIR